MTTENLKRKIENAKAANQLEIYLDEKDYTKIPINAALHRVNELKCYLRQNNYYFSTKSFTPPLGALYRTDYIWKVWWYD